MFISTTHILTDLPGGVIILVTQLPVVCWYFGYPGEVMNPLDAVISVPLHTLKLLVEFTWEQKH